MRTLWRRKDLSLEPEPTQREPIVRVADFVLAHAIEHGASEIAVHPLADSDWPEASTIVDPAIVEGERKPETFGIEEEERWGIWFLIQGSWHLVLSHTATTVQATMRRFLFMADMPYWRSTEGAGSFIGCHKGRDWRFAVEHRPSAQPLLLLIVSPMGDSVEPLA